MEEIHKIADREIRIASFDKRVRKNCVDCRREKENSIRKII